MRVDLRNIQSPIIVFCSWGDDITPPQQALGWILDLYDHEDEIVTAGQTIVYCLHQSIGHLGIFVSGKVATKEHGEFAQAMDLIDVMPPGLYEAVITGVDDSDGQSRAGPRRLPVRLEARTLDAIRALGGNSPEDELRFAAAARVSEINKGLYRTFVGPIVRMAATEQNAAALRDLHPNRLRFQMFADEQSADNAGRRLGRAGARQPPPGRADNPFLAVERMMSDWIAGGLESWGKARDSIVEELFLNLYGAPWLQAAVGLAEMTRDAGPADRAGSGARSGRKTDGSASGAADRDRRAVRGRGPCAALHQNAGGVADERGFAALGRSPASCRRLSASA